MDNSGQKPIDADSLDRTRPVLASRLGVALLDSELDQVYSIARANRTTASEMVRALIQRFLIYQSRPR
jgi:hypothetical protein